MTTTHEEEIEVSAEGWRRRWILALIALGCACIVVSLLCFRMRWGVWPPAVDVLMGLTLLAPIAIPMSFAEVLVEGTPSASSAIPLMLGFWCVFVGLLLCTARFRSKLAFGLLAVISLVASIHWQDMAEGMLGI